MSWLHVHTVSIHILHSISYKNYFLCIYKLVYSNDKVLSDHIQMCEQLTSFVAKEKFVFSPVERLVSALNSTPQSSSTLHSPHEYCMFITAFSQLFLNEQLRKLHHNFFLYDKVYIFLFIWQFGNICSTSKRELPPLSNPVDCFIQSSIYWRESVYHM